MATLALTRTFDNLAFPSLVRHWVHPVEDGNDSSSAEERASYEKALDLVEKIFRRTSFSTLSCEQFHFTLRLVHSLLLSDKEVNPGQYRSQNSEPVCIAKVDFDREIHEPSSFCYFLEIQSQVKKGHDLNEMVEKRLVSPKAIDFIQRSFLMCPSGKDVYPSMEKMRQELQKKNEQHEDPIDIAAFFHEEIGRIHPFLDANGRVARIFMNVILMQGGHEPIAFASEKLYTNALNIPGGFNRLVRKTTEMFDYEAAVDRMVACGASGMPLSVKVSPEYGLPTPRNHSV